MGDSSDSGSLYGEESKMFDDFVPGKYGKLKLSIKEPPELELKPLLEHL